MSSPVLLIFRLGSIGDTVVALPCFHAIARAYSNHHRLLLTNALASVRASSVESVLSGTGLIQETIYYPVGGDALRKFAALLQTLRRRRVRTMVYLQPRPNRLSVWRDCAFFRAAGVSYIVGAPLRGSLLHCQPDPRTHELEFEAERLARTLRPRVQPDLSPAGFDLQLSESEHAAAGIALQTVLPLQTAASDGGMRSAALVAIGAGAKLEHKNWGEKNWAALIGALGSRAAGARFIFVGAADERALAERLSARLPQGGLNLCGMLTPRETAGVLRHCAFLICHDSGPMHLAASQATPCVALFGNTNLPHRWFPYGPGHHVIYEPTGIRNIPVGRVLDAVERMLRLWATDTVTASDSGTRPPHPCGNQRR